MGMPLVLFDCRAPRSNRYYVPVNNRLSRGFGLPWGALIGGLGLARAVGLRLLDYLGRPCLRHQNKSWLAIEWQLLGLWCLHLGRGNGSVC